MKKEGDRNEIDVYVRAARVRAINLRSSGYLLLTLIAKFAFN